MDSYSYHTAEFAVHLLSEFGDQTSSVLTDLEPKTEIWTTEVIKIVIIVVSFAFKPSKLV